MLHGIVKDARNGVEVIFPKLCSLGLGSIEFKYLFSIRY